MSFLDDITNVILGAAGILDQVDSTIADGTILVENVRQEARRIRKFRFDPKWKTRVINAPRAVESTRDLVADVGDTISTAFHAFITNVRAISRTAKGTERDPSGHGEGVGKILGILNEIKLVINEIDLLFKDLNNFLDVLRRVTDELESFDTLFLPQGNKGPKITVDYRKRV